MTLKDMNQKHHVRKRRVGRGTSRTIQRGIHKNTPDDSLKNKLLRNGSLLDNPLLDNPRVVMVIALVVLVALTTYFLGSGITGLPILQTDITYVSADVASTSSINSVYIMDTVAPDVRNAFPLLNSVYNITNTIEIAVNV